MTLVGLSFGAWASARLASTVAPGNLTHLVLIGGLPQLGPELREAYETMANELETDRVGLQTVWDGLIAGCFPSGVAGEVRARVDAMLGSIARERAVRTLRRGARRAGSTSAAPDRNNAR